jgi:type II secretory pathway pseudopilin PulG
MTSPTGNERSDGITLVEVLASAAILSVAAVGLMAALGRSYEAAIQVETCQSAYRFAMSKLGEIEAALRSGEDLPESEQGSIPLHHGRSLAWHLTVHPFLEEEEAIPSHQEVSAPVKRIPRRHVVLEVRWPERREETTRRFEAIFVLPEAGS